jgi:hypothetical protein
MRRLFLLCGLVPLTAVASEHWTRFTSGPIEVFSSAGSKDGRDTLVKFEEFPHALGQGCVFFVLVATDTSTLRDKGGVSIGSTPERQLLGLTSLNGLNGDCSPRHAGV